jgi:Ser/Thr protein kinase RdoA (MazF antagonist)
MAVDKSDIDQAVQLSRIPGFNGKYQLIGTGELNDTLVLTFGERAVIMRIAKFPDQQFLWNEAWALGMLNEPNIPKVLYFDGQLRIKNRLWLLESYVPGAPPVRLSLPQFTRLGALLASVHMYQADNVRVNLWQHFLDGCRAFGDENYLSHHKDRRLQNLVYRGQMLAQAFQPQFNRVRPVLIHGDVTPGNILASGEEISLIDWEFAKYGDPMSDFSTLFYDDMEYGQGRWRIQITAEERSALYGGYSQAGGRLDEERVAVWGLLDKLGSAVFLYWRLHESGRPISPGQANQFQADYEQLLQSLDSRLAG